MKPEALLRRISTGAVQNVAFTDFRRLVEALGFRLLRTSSSHHIFGHAELEELVNVQNVGGQAKPYQIKQLLRLVERYNLKLEPDR